MSNFIQEENDSFQSNKSEVIEMVLKDIPAPKTAGPGGFIGESYDIF